MKLFNFALLASILAGFLITPMAMAEASSPAEIMAACKKEAKDNEIADEDLQNYVRGCMEDSGIDAADVDNLLQQTTPAPAADEGERS
ncbi:MAG: hypothetical protein PVJ39_04255 [Gammaproteobacteria bacterium]|jgi:hypothetical protein